MSLGPWQIVIIVVVLLVFFGPKRIPGMGKSLGEAIRDFKKGLKEDEIDVTDSVKHEQIEQEKQAEAATQAKTEKEKDKA